MTSTGHWSRSEVGVLVIESKIDFSVFIGFAKWLNYILAPKDEYGHILPTKGKTGELPIYNT